MPEAFIQKIAGHLHWTTDITDVENSTLNHFANKHDVCNTTEVYFYIPCTDEIRNVHKRTVVDEAREGSRYPIRHFLIMSDFLDDTELEEALRDATSRGHKGAAEDLLQYGARRKSMRLAREPSEL